MNAAHRKSLSLSLLMCGLGSNSTKESVYAKYNLRLVDQLNGQHDEVQGHDLSILSSPNSHLL